ncbi:MAG: ROK family protein [Candidatus Aenigmatarchaeota archaeon]
MRVGIDVGGSKVNTILLDSNGNVLKSVKYDLLERSEDHLKGLIFKGIEEVAGDQKILGVGLAVPGEIDHENGSLKKAPNISFFEGVKIRDLISEKYGCKVELENDANAFALAESRFGAGKGFNNMVFLTIGTGVGGGIVIGNELYRGMGKAGEIGHTIIIKDGRKCTCGAMGCLEQYASLQGMNFFSMNILGKEFNSKELSKMAETDEKAQEVFHEMGRHLGVGLATLSNILDPEIIIIGGGLSNVPWIMESAEKEMTRYLFSPETRPKVVKSMLGDDAGALGAASLI